MTAVEVLGLDLSDDTVVLALIGIFLAAIAAITGTIAVLQNRRAWRAGRFPELRFAVSDPGRGGLAQVTVINATAIPAPGTSVLVVIGDAVVKGGVGLLEGNGRRVIQTAEPISGIDPVAGLVSCHQPDGSMQTFFAEQDRQERKVYRKRPWRREFPTDEKMFADEFPDVSLDGRRELAWTYPRLAQ